MSGSVERGRGVIQSVSREESHGAGASTEARRGRDDLELDRPALWHHFVGPSVFMVAVTPR